MKKIRITIEIDGKDLYRDYSYQDDSAEIDWNPIINDMVDTLEV